MILSVVKNKGDSYNSIVAEFMGWLMNEYEISNDVHFGCMTYEWKILKSSFQWVK
jgi:hypothetical protein